MKIEKESQNSSQQERKLEEEIISLKIQLEEAKRMEEVMKNHSMMKKEEEVEKLRRRSCLIESKSCQALKKKLKNIHSTRQRRF
jgi:hypothetical protein